MRFLRRKQKRTEGFIQVPTTFGDEGKNNGALMTGVEKGFFEATLFTLSMILHLSHSLEGEHGARS
jgi:hypothetical protein